MSSLVREYRLFHPSDKWKILLPDYALLILNTPIGISPKYLEPVWNKAAIKICVDGGTNRWLNYVDKHKITPSKLYPDMVTGDFDSTRAEFLKKMENNHVKVVNTPDQDHTDFTKALQELSKASDKFSSVIVLVESSGGRLDHTFSNINTLARSSEIFKRDINIYLVGRSSVTFLLQPGSHKIHIPDWIKKFPCGILPFAPKSSSIKTSGLTWNLGGESIEFGGLISSSNLFTEDPQVTITTDTPIIWTMSIDEEDETQTLTHKI